MKALSSLSAEALVTVPAELLVKVLRAAVKVVSLGMLASASATVLLGSAPDGKRKPTRRGSGNITMS